MEEDQPGVFPHLVVDDGEAAIAFYRTALGAEVAFKQMAEDQQRVLHCSLKINGGDLMLCDAFPEFGDTGGMRPPKVVGGTTVTLHINVSDVDEQFVRALNAGAAAIMEPADMFWGARYAKIRDPFGHVWSFGGPTLQPSAA